MFVVVFVNLWHETFVYGPFANGDLAREWLNAASPDNKDEEYYRSWIERVIQPK